MQNLPLTLQCTYPECPGYPEPLKRKCSRCKMGFVHHLCQTAYESVHCKPNGIDLGLLINCYPCLLQVIEEDKKRLYLVVGVVDAQEVIPPETTIPAANIPPIPPLPPQPNMTHYNDEAGDSIPTNIVPRRINFEPPPVVETPN